MGCDGEQWGVMWGCGVAMGMMESDGNMKGSDEW